MAQTDEGAGVLASRFSSLAKGGTGFGRGVNLKDREARERKATKTEAQKARSQGKTKLINFKSTETFQAFLKGFAASESENSGRRVTMTAIIELAVQEYAKAKGFDGDL